ncbi:MAG: type I-C CRISPR-associated protein Cas5c [Clostridia bacterium]
MSFGIRLEAWGKYALFSRPEMKTERVSYDVMTPSAARGLIEAVYWHPGLRWIIDSIRVCKPIRFTNIRRNEISQKISASNVREVMNGKKTPLYINASKTIQQRASLVLTDVHYIISAHFEMTDKAGIGDTPEKFYAMTCERLKTGKQFTQPSFGCREFPANVRLFEGALPDCPPELCGRRELGYMLYDMDYSDAENIRPMFFRATLIDGLMKLEDCGVVS